MFTLWEELVITSETHQTQELWSLLEHDLYSASCLVFGFVEPGTQVRAGALKCCDANVRKGVTDAWISLGLTEQQHTQKCRTLPGQGTQSLKPLHPACTDATLNNCCTDSALSACWLGHNAQHVPVVECVRPLWSALRPHGQGRLTVVHRQEL